MTLDLTESIVPKSDQINSDELIAGPATYTIREVKAGSTEQPFDFMLVETDRAYRPSKTMRRVIVNAWGPEAANYAGRRLTLYREPTIRFAGKEVGGIRISHMSHIDGPVELMAQTTRGTREKFVVKPLPATSAASTGESTPAPASAAATALPAGAAGLDYEPVTLGSVTAQIKLLNESDRKELYGYCGVEGSMTAEIANAFFIAKAHEYGIDFSDPPHIKGILDAARLKRLREVTAEGFQRFADTGEDLDAGSQATIDGEVLA